MQEKNDAGRFFLFWGIGFLALHRAGRSLCDEPARLSERAIANG
jgi:hypothetical protein